MATARFYVDKSRNTGELAIAVLDQWHNKGVGKAMLKALVNAARELRIWTLEAHVLQSNPFMIRLLHKAGLPSSGHAEDGAVRIVLDLREDR